MFELTKIKKIYILSFLFTLHIALSAYVNSTFLIKFIDEKYVGLLYTIASIFTIFFLSQSTTILKHLGNRKLTLTLLIINMISLTGLITGNNIYVIILSFATFLITNSLIFLCLDIFIEHFGDPKTIGRTRGVFLFFVSLAWMISPLITSYLIRVDGYEAVYVLAFGATILMTVGLIFSVRTFQDKIYKRTPFFETYKYLKTNHHMLAITIINFILQFFYAWMIVYTPIYLHQHIGLTWQQTGIIFTMMLSPFVLFELPIGILIDKYHVRKRTLLYFGILIMGLSTLIISLIFSKSILVWGIILFATRTGAALIEATSEIYFFTHITEEDTHLLGVYRDMTHIAYIIAPLIATLIFIFLPFKYLFLILGIFIFSGFYYIPKLKHNHEPNLSNQNQ
jgi:MFS family permease